MIGIASIEAHVGRSIDDLLASLPTCGALCGRAARIIARPQPCSRELHLLDDRGPPPAGF